MSDVPKILRHWSLLNSLCASRIGLTIREMAAEHKVNLRTVRRDLLELQHIGFPLSEERSDHGRKHWRLNGQHSIAALQFTWEEAGALYLARRMLDPLAGSPWWAGSRSAFQKIRAVLNANALRYLDKLAAAFHQTAVGVSDYSAYGDIIDELLRGVEDHRITFITYKSLRTTEPVTAEVYPLGLVWHRSALYLVAHSVEHGEIRHYKVDRVSAVDVQNLPFNRPTEFNLADHLSDSFGIHRSNAATPVRVRVRFDRSVSRYLEEKKWHASQKLTRRRDGSLIAEFRLGDCLNEFRSWILSFGSKALVLEPEGLVREIREEAKFLLGMYTRPSKTPKND